MQRNDWELPFACHMKDLLQSIAYKFRIIEDIKHNYKCQWKKDVTVFSVELRISCTNILYIFGKDLGVTSFFAS